MLANRSIPRCTVIPELAYPDASEAADRLCDVFGFKLRIRIGNHRIQLKRWRRRGRFDRAECERRAGAGSRIPSWCGLPTSIATMSMPTSVGHAFCVHPLIIPTANGNTPARITLAVPGHSPRPSRMSRPRNGEARPASSSSVTVVLVRPAERMTLRSLTPASQPGPFISVITYTAIMQE
jgi:hypothetical protein